MMQRLSVLALMWASLGLSVSLAGAEETAVPMDRTLKTPQGVQIIVRAQGPYDADVPLQVVCFFKHKPAGDKMLGAAAELDKRLRGAISALRNSGQFIGDEQETFLLVPPPGLIQPKALLLIGLGDEASLKVETLERVGRTALREAVRQGATKVAFAPLLRDQGNDTLAIGPVETAAIRGMLLAYDTETRLQKERLAAPYVLESWVVEAGLKFFDDTIPGVQKGIDEATQQAAARPATLLTPKGI